MTMTPAVFFFISGVRREKYGWLAGLADTMNECNMSRIPLFIKMHTYLPTCINIYAGHSARFAGHYKYNYIVRAIIKITKYSKSL